jgi:hypothetical protein
MLAVCLPERRRLVLHPAPPPCGTAPAWVNAAPSAPTGLPVPGVADLASLALRSAYERLEAGAAVSLHDVAGLLRLQREIEREAAGQDAGSAGRWRATLREVLWLARRHLGDGWAAFAADVRASGDLAAMWGPPSPRPAARL